MFRGVERIHRCKLDLLVTTLTECILIKSKEITGSVIYMLVLNMILVTCWEIKLGWGSQSGTFGFVVTKTKQKRIVLSLVLRSFTMDKNCLMIFGTHG